MTISVTSRTTRVLAGGALVAAFAVAVPPNAFAGTANGKTSGTAGSTNGTACEPNAKKLLVTFQPTDETLDPTVYFRSQLTLANSDTRCGLNGNWALYFNSVRQPMAVYPPGTLGDNARTQLAQQGLTVARADKAQSGDFYVLRPTADFKPVKPGEHRVITIDFELWALQKTDAPAGFSITYSNGKPHWVPARSLFDPTDPKVTKAFSGDARPEQTAATRYADNTASQQTLPLQNSIVPQPLWAKAAGGTFVLHGGAVHVNAPKSLRGEADYLKQALGNVLGGKSHGKQTITLRLNSKLDTVHDGKPHPDSYTLDITGKGITIVGNTSAGVLYGVQSLRQIIPASAYQAASQGRKPTTIPLPQSSVKDAPLLAYRGLGIDVSRHFESVQTVEKFIDLESYLKMNALHLHLTDDEGWRLQIPGLPELTDFGSKRGFDPNETKQLHQGMGAGSGLGSGDNILGKAANPTQANLGRTPAYQGFEDATRNFLGQGDGYYTTAQFESILRYAAQRHVQVIPEFDLPAHARAAVQSMERRYQATGDSTYRLLDPNDTSKHSSVQYYNDNVVNPCVPGTYNFITKVTTEVAKMYKAAGVPLKVVSMGGDEAPANAWDGSQACKTNPATTGKSDAQLWDYFEGKYNTIAQKVAPQTSGWEDVLLDGAGNSKLSNFVALPWQNVWGWGREQVAYQLANAGTPVILASATNLYMDLAYNKDPNEPGYYWAEYVDEKSTFTYQPYDIYANDTEDRWGNPSKPDPNWTQLTAQGKQNVLGLEAEMFGENGDNAQIREYQAFPKLLGAAERAWYRNTPAPAQMNAAFNVFNNTLGQKTFPLLSYYQPVGLPRSASGVNYRIPLPGGQISGGTLTVNLRDPGMTLQYSTDGVHWTTYTGPVHVGDTALLRTLAVDGRSSRLSPVGLPNWAATPSYPAGSLVNYKGNIYRAVHSTSAGQTPETAPSLWTELQ